MCNTPIGCEQLLLCMIAAKWVQILPVGAVLACLRSTFAARCSSSTSSCEASCLSWLMEVAISFCCLRAFSSASACGKMAVHLTQVGAQRRKQLTASFGARHTLLTPEGGHLPPPLLLVALCPGLGARHAPVNARCTGCLSLFRPLICCLVHLRTIITMSSAADPTVGCTTQTSSNGRG